ncbi:N-acyl homoserine lactonase family protein [Aurantiacibacter xanthus]|uniref:N-acyl homoserine lactonase family protein n=1 Tax=Aurantiacibacter xanthus TaxID=1784712 RepID=A0A3A1P0V1_9SPHN|nr:N-acyl homoserine lactonase family protein [Aurantiacibacter xanthus]RIV81952.1 N-acyl homoserine lactonase family protein [Aurantiacibacter xanthus]
MSNWTVTSLRIGEIYIPHDGAIQRDPIHCWLARNGEHNVLVDTGMTDIAMVTRRLKVEGWGGGHEYMTKALAAEGLEPSDIDHIVLTHGHFDHADNLDLFPDACVVIQRDELAHAADPVPSQRIFYWNTTVENLVARRRPKQIRTLDGDVVLFPGFRILKVPSHTPGMQVPILTTAKGDVAIASDLGDHYRYWFPADPRATTRPQRSLADAYLTGNIRSESERDWQAAMRRVQAESDIVIPAHDFRIPVRVPEDWWDIPESNEGDLASVPPDRETDNLAKGRG